MCWRCSFSILLGPYKQATWDKLLTSFAQEKPKTPELGTWLGGRGATQLMGDRDQS